MTPVQIPFLTDVINFFTSEAAIRAMFLLISIGIVTTILSAFDGLFRR